MAVPSRIWEDITMDFVEGLPKSLGNDTIFVVIDRLSKYAHFIPLCHPFTTKTVASAFIKEVVRLHGFPQFIISDRDKVFLSNFWTELFRIQGTKLRSTAYHPLTDGQTEMVNKCLFVVSLPERGVNRCRGLNIGITPHSMDRWVLHHFRRFMGSHAPLISYGSSRTANDTLDQELIDKDHALALLKENLTRAQGRMKKYADEKRSECEFVVGEKVFLKIRPYRQKSRVRKRNEKLSAKWFGPYEITEHIGKVAYHLALPDYAAIQPVFHVSQLKQARGPLLAVQHIPPHLNEELEWLAIPEEVFANSINDTIGEAEALVSWKGLPPEEELGNLSMTWHISSLISTLGTRWI